MKAMGRLPQYPKELRERAVRMFLETKSEYPFEFTAMKSIAQKLGINSPETLRKWIRQAEVDAGRRAGVSSDDSEQIKALKRENAELRRANEILKSASAFFAAELDRPRRS
jgi:transposase